MSRTGRAAARLRGLLALVVLLTLMVGIPAGLLAVAGNPLTGTLPGVQDLLRPDDGSLFLTVLVVVGWFGWASFTVSVLLEAAATVRGRPTPRLPALHLQQRAAAGLVGAIAVLFTIGAPVALAASPAAALPAAATDRAAAVQPVAAVPSRRLQQQATTPSAQAPDEPADTAPPSRSHVVSPGETLWSIAEQHLGDGQRFRAIAQLNYGRTQPDGAALRDGDWIRPGWVLTLPPDPAGTTPAGDQAPDDELRTVQRGDTLSKIALQEYGDPGDYPRIAAASRQIEQPGGVYLRDPDVIDVGWTVRIPAATGTQTAREEPDQAVPDPAGATTVPPKPVPGPVPDAAQPADRAGQPPAGPGSQKLEPTDVPSRAPVADPASQPTAPPNSPAVVDGGSAPEPAVTAPTVAGALGPSAEPSPAAATQAQEQQVEPTDDDSGYPVRTVAGVGSLLAAGVLTLLATRRSSQQRRRRPGQALPLPDQDAAQLEQQLRATADELSLETVDLALRHLSADCTRTGRPLPVVRAARMTAGQFDLYLAEPGRLPEPWAGTADSTIWSLPAHSTDLLDLDVALDVAAPYPSLVTVGHDEEDGNVLLDLEHLGSLNIGGVDADAVREVLAAIAVELATSRWADDLQVTLVGAYPELESCLRSGRVRYLPAVGGLIEQLAERAASDREQMQTQNATDLQHARAAGLAIDTWTPQIVLLASPLTDRQHDELQQLLQALPRVAVAAVTSGRPLGEWGLRVDDGGAVLEPIGLRLRPQRLTDQDYARLLEVLAVADTDDPQPHPGKQTPAEPSPDNLPAAAEAPRDEPSGHLTSPAPSGTLRVVSSTRVVTSAAGVPTAHGTDHPGRAVVPPVPSYVDTRDGDDLAPRTAADNNPDQEAGPTSQDREGADDELTFDVARPAPRLLLLGPPQLQHTHGVLPQPSHTNRATELAAFLHLNPGARTEEVRDLVFGSARNRPNNKTVAQAISRLRRWLGGQEEYLPKSESGRYRLGPAVTSDWQDWQDLLPDDATTASTHALEQALALVRGRPLSAVSPRTYSWAEPVVQRINAQILDAAGELAHRQLMAGHYLHVQQTVSTGLLVEAGVERLWRLRLLAAHGSGDLELEQDSVEQLLTLTDHIGADLEPQTRQLLEQLSDPTTARLADQTR